MKIALVTDTHFGARNDSLVFGRYFKRFYDEIFFPYLKEHEVSNIIHLGDIVDRRKFINYLTIKNFRESFYLPSIGMNVHALIGNHDTYFKNTNEVNSMKELFTFPLNHFNYYDEPSEVEFDGTKILLMPWINSGNYARCMKIIEETTATIMMAHLEIQGFEMYKNSVNDHGFDKDIFKKFDMVMTGHFHHKSSQENIHYLGAPYQITWSDFGDYRGFHIFDTKDRSLEYIQNPLTIFNKLFYDDSERDLESMISELDSKKNILRESFVKVVVKQKNNPYNFDLYIDTLEKIGIENLQIVEDHLNLNLEEDSDIINDVDDTISFLKKYVEKLEIKTEKSKIESLLQTLYNEALTVE